MSFHVGSSVSMSWLSVVSSAMVLVLGVMRYLHAFSIFLKCISLSGLLGCYRRRGRVDLDFV